MKIFLFISLFSCLFLYSAYSQNTSTFKEQEYNRESVTSALKYLRMAAIELENTGGSSEIREQINGIIKYLSVKNLDGDYFSQYARQNSAKILDAMKGEYLNNKTSGKYNKKVIMEKRIRDKLYNSDKYNFSGEEKNKSVNTPGSKDDNKELNNNMIRDFK